MNENKAVEPIFESYANPIEGAAFSYYEIQTNRAYQDASGEQYIEAYTDDAYFDDDFACGPVLYGIYGRFTEGGVEHICDRAELDFARDTLRSMIGALDAESRKIYLVKS